MLVNRFLQVILMKVLIGMDLLLGSPDQEVMHNMYISFSEKDIEIIINNIQVIDFIQFKDFA